MEDIQYILGESLLSNYKRKVTTHKYWSRGWHTEVLSVVNSDLAGLNHTRETWIAAQREPEAQFQQN